MANIRVIYDNAADRAATLAASTTQGSLAASNMQNDFKGQVHRSSGTSVTYTLTWSALETIGGIVLPATNLSGSATIRVRLYLDAAGTTLLADSGTVNAAAGLNLGLWNWSQPLNANAFSFGGLSKTQVWFAAQQACQRCVIDIVDSSNAAGYIDCARLVIGQYWEAHTNPDLGGVEASIVDTTQNSRNDSGDNLSDRGTLHEKLTVNLKQLDETDRSTLQGIALKAGSNRNVVVSVLPGNTSPAAERDYLCYGKFAPIAITPWWPTLYSSKLEQEGW